jgi:hypothetical protein
MGRRGDRVRRLGLAAEIAGLAVWKVGRYFDYTGMHATRRQLSKLGLFDEDGEGVEDPPAPPAAGNGGP